MTILVCQYALLSSLCSSGFPVCPRRGNKKVEKETTAGRLVDQEFTFIKLEASQNFMPQVALIAFFGAHKQIIAIQA